jgi:hypothetical protein
VPLQFTSPKVVKYWTGSAWAESQDFGNIKMWNGSIWRVVDIRPYADVSEETQTVTVGSLLFKGIENYGFDSVHLQVTQNYFLFRWLSFAFDSITLIRFFFLNPYFLQSCSDSL